MQTLSGGEFGRYHDTKYTIVIWLETQGVLEESLENICFLKS